MRGFIAALKFLGFLLLCLFVVPLQSIILALHKGRYSYILPRLWHKCVCFIFRIRYQIIGTPNTGKQTMYMSNHISYLDIPLIGATLKASFLAKSEVAGWPVFGFLSKLQRTAFIVRTRESITKAKDELQERIDGGESLIIFPEGTSTDGLSIKPLKSSLFELAVANNMAVQGMTIELAAVNGKEPQTTQERRIYTWPIEDDIDIGAHLWRFAKAKNVTIRLHFHEILQPADFENRKALSQKCHEQMSQGLPLAKAA